jgi:choline transport protein
MTLVVLSLAEMASMAPTSGGQYHWVSEFAPPEYQKLLSYFTGWMSAMSWQAGAASGPFLVGTMIQSLVYVNKESYEATNWQGTMMVGSIDIAVWAITFIVYLGNVYGGRAMPVFQNVMLIVHVFGFFAVSYNHDSALVYPAHDYDRSSSCSGFWHRAIPPLLSLHSSPTAVAGLAWVWPLW